MVNKPEYRTLEGLLFAVRKCRACEKHLPLGPRPILQVGESARVLIVGQAPGARVHASGTPWDDPSGKRLRECSARNTPWFQRNPWFEHELLPELRERIKSLFI